MFLASNQVPDSISSFKELKRYMSLREVEAIYKQMHGHGGKEEQKGRGENKGK